MSPRIADLVSSIAVQSMQDMESTAATVMKQFEDSTKSLRPLLEQVKIEQEKVIKALDLPKLEPLFKEVARISEQSKEFHSLSNEVARPLFSRPRYSSFSIPLESYDYEENNEIEQLKEPEQTTFITFDSTTGNFFHKGIKIDFPDGNACYVLVLKAIFSKKDKEGFCSFATIDKFLEQAGQGRIVDKSKKEKRIHNALERLYRKRENKASIFPRNIPDGTPLLKVMRGKGIVLNNPQI